MSQSIEFKYFKLVDYREICTSYYSSVENDLFVSWLFKSFSQQCNIVECNHYAGFVDQAITLFHFVILSTPGTNYCLLHHASRNEGNLSCTFRHGLGQKNDSSSPCLSSSDCSFLPVSEMKNLCVNWAICLITEPMHQEV